MPKTKSASLFLQDNNKTEIDKKLIRNRMLIIIIEVKGVE